MAVQLVPVEPLASLVVSWPRWISLAGLLDDLGADTREHSTENHGDPVSADTAADWALRLDSALTHDDIVVVTVGNLDGPDAVHRHLRVAQAQMVRPVLSFEAPPHLRPLLALAHRTDDHYAIAKDLCTGLLAAPYSVRPASPATLRWVDALAGFFRTSGGFAQF